jgi:transposase
MKLVSGVSTSAQLTRRHEIPSGLLYHWKKQQYKNLFADTPNREAALQERVTQLEQLFGKLTVENDFFNKALQRSLTPEKKNNSLLATTGICSRPSIGGAK